jgi:hypothetical protein
MWSDDGAAAWTVQDASPLRSRLFLAATSSVPAVGAPAVVSRAEFERRWKALTGGLFQGFDWRHVVVAGGAVAACLDPSTDVTAPGHPQRPKDVDFRPWPDAERRSAGVLGDRSVRPHIDSGQGGLRHAADEAHDDDRLRRPHVAAAADGARALAVGCGCAVDGRRGLLLRGLRRALGAGDGARRAGVDASGELRAGLARGGRGDARTRCGCGSTGAARVRGGGDGPDDGGVGDAASEGASCGRGQRRRAARRGRWRRRLQGYSG